MNDRQIEQLLGSLPRRTADVRREAQLLEQLTRARDGAANWWSRPVALWRAVAACLVVAIVSGGLAWLTARKAVVPDPRSLPRHTTFVRLDTPLFERANQTREVAVSRWTTLSSWPKGDRQ